MTFSPPILAQVSCDQTPSIMPSAKYSSAGSPGKDAPAEGQRSRQRIARVSPERGLRCAIDGSQHFAEARGFQIQFRIKIDQANFLCRPVFQPRVRPGSSRWAASSAGSGRRSVGDTLERQDVPGVAAIHHPLRKIDCRRRRRWTIVHIPQPARSGLCGSQCAEKFPDVSRARPDLQHAFQRSLWIIERSRSFPSPFSRRSASAVASAGAEALGLAGRSRFSSPMSSRSACS